MGRSGLNEAKTKHCQCDEAQQEDTSRTRGIRARGPEVRLLVRLCCDQAMNKIYFSNMQFHIYWFLSPQPPICSLSDSSLHLLAS